jgi:hexosaminidase
MQLFPSGFIHIGGDEVPKARWKACPKCQARMKRENLKDEHELQSWFIRRIDKFFADNGRRLVGWDEILEGGLAPGATVQSWRGMEGAVAAAASGHDTIVSPTSHCYLDYNYTRTPVEKSYAFEPVPPQLTAEQARHVLGLEGNIWAEHTPTLKDVDRQVWPRLCALSEVAWSDPKGRSFDEFAPRLEVHVARLRLMGIEPGPTTRPTTKPTTR